MANQQSHETTAVTVKPQDSTRAYQRVPSDAQITAYAATGQVPGSDPRASGGQRILPPLPRRRIAEVGESEKVVLDSDYQLIGPIGEGGRGEVLLTRQIGLGRSVAFKRIKADLADDTEIQERLILEALIIAALDHPHIIPVYEVGYDQESKPFYTMARVNGRPWNETIRQTTLEDDIHVLIAVGDAIAHAHSRGILHLDIKPHNVLVAANDVVHVIDWGLALSDPAGPRTSLAPLPVPAMAVSGTPGYMAPELAKGQGSLIGQRTDVYQLGAVLYRILTGYPPHQGKDIAAAVESARRNTITKPLKCDPELADLALQAMATDPQERIPTVADLVARLRTWRQHAASRSLTSQALDAYRTAIDGSGYNGLLTALAGFQAAIERWPENRRAIRGQQRCHMALATRALERGDLELAEAQLPADSPEATAIRVRLNKARHRRRRQQQAEAGPGRFPINDDNDGFIDLVSGSFAEPSFLARWSPSIGVRLEPTAQGVTATGSSPWWLTTALPVPGDFRLRLSIRSATPHPGEVTLALSARPLPTPDDELQIRPDTGLEVKFGAYDHTLDLILRDGRRLWTALLSSRSRFWEQVPCRR